MANKLYSDLPLVKSRSESLDTVWSYLDLFILAIGISGIGLFLGLSRPDWQERRGGGLPVMRESIPGKDPNELHKTPESDTKNSTFFRGKDLISAASGTIYSMLTSERCDNNRLIQSYKHIKRESVDSGSLLFFILSGVPRVLQEFTLTRLEHLVGRELATFLVGLFFGSEVLRGPQLSETFSSVGLSHVLSASGYNVGLIARLFGAGNVRGKALWRRFCILSGISCYAWLTGGSPPVVRSVIQASYVMAAGLVGRPAHPLGPVFFAMIVTLLLRNDWLDSVSFWLSVFASLGLVLFARENSSFSFSQLSGFSSDLRSTLAASAFTVPLIAWRFAVFSPIAFVVNPLFLWTIQWWMRLTVVLFLAGDWASSFLPRAMFELWEMLFGTIMELLKLMGLLPFASWSLGSFRWTFGFSWLFCCFFVLFHRRQNAEIAAQVRKRLKTEH